MLEIMKKCCIRDETQLEAKIKNHKERLPSIPEELTKSNELYNKPTTRSKK
tara:strand:- start:109 stop:261 length:153 start_codon:yes stop_codon:yes gene_type:complete